MARLIALVVIVGLGGLAFWGQLNGECSRNGLYSAFKEKVLLDLVSPATAEFPPADTAITIYSKERCSAVINTYVDSQNRFGAMIRSEAKGVVKKEGGEVVVTSIFISSN